MLLVCPRWQRTMERSGQNGLAAVTPHHRRARTLAVIASSRAAELPQRSLELARTAAQVAHDNRGQDIIVLDMRELTQVFDFFVVVTGTSRRQLHAVAEEIDRVLSERYGEKRLGLEGYVAGTWILQDYGDVVVHLFDHHAREYYALEQLWSEAQKVEWQADPGPQIATADGTRDP